MKKALLALALVAACNAHAALIVGDVYQDNTGANWTYVGDYNIASGPAWSTHPTDYTGLQAAALVFGALTDGKQYALSTSTSMVDHMAWYDGYADGTHLPTTNPNGGGVALAENFFSDVGAPGYNTYGDYSAYIGQDRASAGGAYNHVFVSDVPEPASLALFALGLTAVGVARRKAKSGK